MKTKHGDIPHIIPDQIKKQHRFLKEYSDICKKYGFVIVYGYSENLEIEDIEYNDTNINSYITGIDLI